MNALVSIVFSHRKPTTIRRRIAQIVVSAIQRQVIFVSVSHGPFVVGLRVFQPFPANPNATATIVVVGLTVGIVATLNGTPEDSHDPFSACEPDTIDRRGWIETVTTIHQVWVVDLINALPDASPTGTYQPVFEDRGNVLADNCKALKLFSNKIQQAVVEYVHFDVIAMNQLGVFEKHGLFFGEVWRTNVLPVGKIEPVDNNRFAFYCLQGTLPPAFGRRT